MQDVLQAFCAHREVSEEGIIQVRKSQKESHTRYMIWHYLHFHEKWTTTRLSKTFRRNVPSIFRGIRIIRELMSVESTLRQDYQEVVKKIESGT